MDDSNARRNIQAISDVQAAIEESLARLPEADLPPELEGLRSLLVGGRRVRVSVRYVESPRTANEEGAFDPDRCQIVIWSLPDSSIEADGGRSGFPDADAEPGPRFQPIRIQGGMISDTVLEDRG